MRFLAQLGSIGSSQLFASPFMHLLPQERTALELFAEAEILQEHNIAVIQEAGGTVTVGEPMFVARLCRALTSMASGWRSQLRTIDPRARLSITAIFTHQKPYVRFPSGASATNRCELADLAVVLIDRSNPSHVMSRCMFVQAKRADAPLAILSTAGDLGQLAFYTNRPTFDVARRKAPDNIQFPAPTPDNALNYGFTPPTTAKSGPIGASWANTRWMLAQNLNGHATHQLTGTRSLQAALVDLLEGTAGWDFDLAGPNQNWTTFSGTDNWSALVNFILEDTAAAQAPSYVKVLHQKRGFGEQLMFLTQFDTSSGAFMVNLSRDEISHAFAVGVRERLQRAHRIGVNGGDLPPDGPREPVYDEEEGGPMSVAVIEVTMQRRG